MAINYDSAGGLFTEIGNYIAGVNEFETFISTTMAARQTNTETDVRAAALDGVKTYFDSLATALDTKRDEMGDFVDARILDYDTIITELNVPAETLSWVLPALRRRMVLDSEHVAACATTVGSATANSDNVGDGTAVATLVLDGYNAPGPYFYADQGYAGLTSQMCGNEDLVLECTNDSQRAPSTISEGYEQWQIYGLPTNGTDPTHLWLPGEKGTGYSGSSALTTAKGASKTVQGDFEEWTGSPAEATGWTKLGSETWGTEIAQEASEVYRGTYAFKIVGDGATATIGVYQNLAVSSYTPLRMYRCFVRYKASATAASGTFTVLLTGTGYTAATSEKVEIAGGSLATSWTLTGFWIVMPEYIPTDMRIEIKATGTLTAARSIYIDDVFLVPAVYWGGVGFAVAPGAQPWMKGDKVSFSVTNDWAGKFQKFWIRRYGRQLPTDGTPSISDALVA